MKKYVVLFLLLISSLLLTFYLSSKKEENTKEINKIEKILSKPNGIQAYTLNGEKTNLSYNDLINSYVVDSITCKNGTIATYNSSDKSISFSNIKMPDYCTINFKHTFYSKLLSDNSTISERTDFSTTFTTTNTGTLYKATEKNVHNTSDTTVYYFAGDAKNNWVKFGGYYWRIIRTNHDGSVRLLYSGTSPDTTEGYIGESVFNTEYNSPKYVGYMYGNSDTTLDEARTNTNNSTIKTYIDNWYSTNLSSYTKYISTEAVYCNDRNEEITGTYNIGSTTFYYAPRYRAYSSYIPTYDCTNSKDAFSGSNSEAKLTYPMGLMTADEIMYAGGKGGTNLTSPYAWYYLNGAGSSITGSIFWWSLSPNAWVDNISYMWHVDGSSAPGYFTGNHVNSSGGVRPVISLKGNLIWKSGDGSSSNPYEVEDLPPSLLVEDIKTKSFTNEDGVYNENGYRYEGSDPSNYIYMTNKSTNEKELWRIIGVFNDGENGEEVIRVRRHYEKNSYPEMAYDTGSSTAYNYKNISETNENLLAYNGILNKNYIAAPELGCPDCTYANHFPTTTMYNTLFTTYSLTNYANTVNFKVYLGTSSSYTTLTASDWYTAERGSTPGGASSSSYSSSVLFTGPVGLMYPSDYGYGVLASDCERSKSLYNYGGTATCYNNNWLFQGSSQWQWLISPSASTLNYVFIVETTGYVYVGSFYDTGDVTDVGAFSPVMALSSDVVVNGSGTKNDPYVIVD